MTTRGFRAAACLVAATLGSAAAAQEPSPSPQPSPEPGTRAALWQALRDERVAKLRPYDPGFVESQVLAFEKAERPSLLDFNVARFYPRFAGIARGSAVAAGARLWRPDMGRARLDLHGSAFLSLKGYEFYDLQFGRIPHRASQFPARSTQTLEVYRLGDLEPGQGRLILFGSARYQHFPRVHYFGPGPEARAEDKTDYLDQKSAFEVIGGCQFTPRLSVTARVGYLQAFVGRGESPQLPSTGDVFTEAQVPGLARQPDFWLVGGQVLWDGRDTPGNPRRGAMLALQASHAQDRGDGAYGFTRVAADVRGHLPLGSVQRSLALRAFLSSDNADAGARVPFYMQQDLGGSHTLRGFESFRFRDDEVLLLQAEYRWYPSPAIELALFVDAGRVASRFGDVFGDLEADAGFGIRLKTDDATLFRLDTAKSREGWRVMARFSNVF